MLYETVQNLTRSNEFLKYFDFLIHRASMFYLFLAFLALKFMIFHLF